MNTIKKLRKTLKKGKEYAQAMDKATKLRFDKLTVARQIKYGVPGVNKGLVGNKQYQSLSEAGKKVAFIIVDEECDRQNEYKAKELVKIAKRIEKRLKKECR